MLKLVAREWLKPIRRHPIICVVLFVLGLLLGGVPATCGQYQTPLGKMGYRSISNKELAKKTLELVAVLRGMVKEMNAADDRKRVECDEQELRAKIGDARTEVRRKCHDESMRAMQDFISRYNEKYKADALILREELLHRVPELRKKAGPPILFNHPTNPLGLEEVATSLEVMAKLLPQGNVPAAK
jgi:hypothetical protein